MPRASFLLQLTLFYALAGFAQDSQPTANKAPDTQDPDKTDAVTALLPNVVNVTASRTAEETANIPQAINTVSMETLLERQPGDSQCVAPRGTGHL